MTSLMLISGLSTFSYFSKTSFFFFTSIIADNNTQHSSLYLCSIKHAHQGRRGCRRSRSPRSLTDTPFSWPSVHTAFASELKQKKSNYRLFEIHLSSNWMVSRCKVAIWNKERALLRRKLRSSTEVFNWRHIFRIGDGGNGSATAAGFCQEHQASFCAADTAERQCFCQGCRKGKSENPAEW